METWDTGLKTVLVVPRIQGMSIQQAVGAAETDSVVSGAVTVTGAQIQCS